MTIVLFLSLFALLSVTAASLGAAGSGRGMVRGVPRRANSHLKHPGRPSLPAWFWRQALCIHRYESIDWHRAGIDWRGKPSLYYGGLQFLDSTWQSAGGKGHASDASPAEQVYRAWIVVRRDSGRWHDEWGTAGRCGLR